MMRKVIAHLLVLVMVVSNIAFDYTNIYASAGTGTEASISFDKSGTETNPLVDVTVDTGGKEIIGITYEKGYDRTAEMTSNRIYGHEEKTGIVKFSIDEVVRFISVMVVLYDPTDGTTSNIVGSYELDGKHIFNAGSGTFSYYPTVPLTDGTNEDTLMGDRVSVTDGSNGNGPIVVIEDEVWVIDSEGNIFIYDKNDVDEVFGTTTDIPLKAKIETGIAFDEKSNSLVYDGRHVFAKRESANLVIIDATTRQVYADDAMKNVITDYTHDSTHPFYNRVTSLAYDGIYLYVLAIPTYNGWGIETNPGELYRLKRQSDGTYKMESEVKTFPRTQVEEYHNENDMVTDGTYMYMVSFEHYNWTSYNGKFTRFDLTDFPNGEVTEYLTNGPMSRIMYDGSNYVYGIPAQGVGSSGQTGWKEVNRLDINSGITASIYNDMIPARGQLEDISWDGRNIWVHSFGANNAARYRYDTVVNQRMEVPTSRWHQADKDSDSHENVENGVYDGKYQWSYNVKNRTVSVVGHENNLRFGDGATDTNLEKFFRVESNLPDDTEVIVDDKSTTSPDYVDIRIKSGYSDSDIVYAAWTYDATKQVADTRDLEFFTDLNNYDTDRDHKEDWKEYGNKSGKYYALQQDELPTVRADGTFLFDMVTYPKLNGYYTLYMINELGRDSIETIYVDNYMQLSTLIITFEDIETGEVIHEAIEDTLPAGKTVTVSTNRFEAILKEKGYKVVGETEKEVELDIIASNINDVSFDVTKDNDGWTEIIKKPYFLDNDGTKQYIGDEIETGQRFLVTAEDVTDPNEFVKIMVDAPHIEGFSLYAPSEATKEVVLPRENGGDSTGPGRTEVEFRYAKSGTSILTKGIEVDSNGDATGNILYVEQVKGEAGDKETIKAKTVGLENYDLIGLVNYNKDDGSILSITNDQSEKEIMFGVDTEIAFAYERKVVDVIVKYLDSSGKEIADLDTFAVPLNTEFTATGKAVENYELVSSTTYKKTETITEDGQVIPFEYKPLDAIVVIEAVDSETNEVLAIISDNSHNIGAKDVAVNVGSLETMLEPGYKLDEISPKNLEEVENGSKVQFKFKKQLTTVTVKHLDSDGNEVFDGDEYTVMYGETIKESAVSNNTYFFKSVTSSEGNETNPTVENVANSATEEITFVYEIQESAVVVMALDSDTNELLYYNIEEGKATETLTVKEDEYFNDKIVDYNSYKLISPTNGEVTTTYADKELLVFTYQKQKYTVTISAEDTKGNELKFYDGTTTKTFTYSSGDDYYIYAPVIEEGYVIEEISEAATQGFNISRDASHTFVYKGIEDENIVVKAISTDGELLGDKVIQGADGQSVTVKLSDYPNLYDSNKWEFDNTDSDEKNAQFGTDDEVTFKFKRKQVELIVNHVDESNDPIITAETIKVNSESVEKVFNALDNSALLNYELAPGENGFKNVTIGTESLEVTFKYVHKNESVMVIAKDENDKILEKYFYGDATVGESYEIDETDLAKNLAIHSNTSYSFNEGNSSLTLATVESDVSKNILYASYDSVKANVTIEYIDTSGSQLKPDLNKVLQLGGNIDENAITVTYHNFSKAMVTPNTVISTSSSAITINGTNVQIKNVDQNYKITFVYESIVRDGVINLIAKDQNGNVLDFKSYKGKIGTEQTFDANSEFDITGYKLKNPTESTQTATYNNGHLDLVFIYEADEVTVTIKAEEKDSKESISFTGKSAYKVKKGHDITVYAPHIEGYVVVGDKSETFTEVMTPQTATFTYEPTSEMIVVKGVEVNSAGNQIVSIVYTNIETGNETDTKQINAIASSEEWELIGLAELDENGELVSIEEDVNSKNVTFGVEQEVVFAYKRNYTDVLVNYMEKGTPNVLIDTETITVPINTNVDVYAKAFEGYMLIDASTYKQSVNANGSHNEVTFLYEELNGTIILEARLGSEDGELLAQTAEDIQIGTEDVKVYATELEGMLSQRYILDTSKTEAEFEIEKVQQGTVVTYIFKEQVGNIVIKYLDDDGKQIAEDKKDDNVPYGTKVVESAISIKGYYLNNAKSQPTKEIIVESPSHEHTFYYSKNTELETNLSIKAVSKDGEILIGSEMLVNDSGVIETIDIKDYPNLYNEEEWELVGDSTQSATYGTDMEVIFTLERKAVNVTVKYEDDNGAELQAQKVESYPTNTPYTAVAEPIVGYALQTGQKQIVTQNVGTKDVEIVIKYRKTSGNVTIQAVDADTGELLALDQAEESSSSYTVDSDVISNFDDALVGYIHDSESSKLTIDVDSDVSKNVATVAYRKEVANILVRYVDEDRNDIASAKTYTAPHGHTLTEYAIDIAYYNLVNNDEYKYNVDSVTGDITIEFEYYLVKYNVEPEGVINVIAKTDDEKILDVKSYRGKLGENKEFDAADIFRNITGYELKSAQTKTTTFENGFKEVVFVYEAVGLKVEIVAVDSSENTLEFTESHMLSVQEGDNVTVHAPHITGYDVTGYEIVDDTTTNGTGTASYVTISNIAKNEKVIFKYRKTDVASNIYVKHISFINGYQVEILTETKSGNIGEVIFVSPLDASSLSGYKVNPNSDIVKTVTFGQDKEVVFLYDRDMHTLNLNFNINIYEDYDSYNSGTVYHTVTETEKIGTNPKSEYYAPQLANIVERQEIETRKTIIVPFNENYVIDLKAHGGKMPSLRENIIITGDRGEDYYYRNILGNVLIRAVVEDDEGTLNIDGKKYKLLAQIDDEGAVDVKYTKAQADAKNAELESHLSPAYVSVGLLAGEIDFVPHVGDKYKDHIITYVYTGDYKKIEAHYVDANEATINASLLGLPNNPYEMNVLNGDTYSAYAININNYNFDGYSENFVDPTPMLRTESVNNHATGVANSDGVIEFKYTLVSNNTTIVIKGDGLDREPIQMQVSEGQVLYAPYVEGYRPNVESYTINDIEGVYEFEYTKIEDNSGSKIVYDTIVEYKYVYKDKEETEENSDDNDKASLAEDYGRLMASFVHEPYITGYTDGTVRPDGEITRSEIVSILYSILYDENVVPSKNVSFTDVSDDEWYAEKVDYLAGLGYIHGYSDGTFRPNNNITREELAAIMSRIFGDGYEGEIDGISLEDYWARDAIVDSYASGFYNDMNVANSTYNWTQPSTRAEVIVMVNNALNRIPNSEFLDTVNIPLDLNKSHWAYYHVLEAVTYHSGYYEGNFGSEKEVVDSIED